MRVSASRPVGAMRVRGWLALVFVIALALPSPASAGAAPLPGASLPAMSHAAPDWMSQEMAARLDLGFDVFVPPDLPSPFQDAPAVEAWDGYYSLYWVLPGAPPTFLQIVGKAGGDIPDYSKYDRNVQLEQNAEVNGVPAYHDLTPIYDLVYWRIDNVVYSVESRNLTEDDSLSLANALAVLYETERSDHQDDGETVVLGVPGEVNAGDQVAIEIGGVDGSTLTVDHGYFTETGEDVYYGVSEGSLIWQSPVPSEDTLVSFILIDPETGDWLATASTVVVAAWVETTLALDCPASALAGASMTFTLTGSGVAIIDAGDGYFPAEWPNTDFAPDVDGGSTMVGTVPDAGEITLVWTAPSTGESLLVYLFASTEAGETPGECEIAVEPASSTGDSAGANGEVQAAEVDGNTGAADEASRQEESTSTPEARPRKTPEVYNEVEGLPTIAPESESETGSAGPDNPAPSPTTTPNVRPTATFAPTTLEDGTVASVIGSEGGRLVSPAGASVEIPPGALAERSTLTIQPVANTKLPVQEGIDLIPDSAFDVTVAGPDGRAILALAVPAELTIDLGEDRMRSGAKLYRVDGTSLVPLTDVRTKGDKLIVPVSTFARFVAGVPVPVASKPGRSVLPFVLAAIVVIGAFIVMVILSGMFRPRRQRVVTTRRPPRSRYR